MGAFCISRRDVCVSLQFTIQLNIFAGQLYFGSELEAILVCHYLGINLYTDDEDAMRPKAAILCILTVRETTTIHVFVCTLSAQQEQY